MGYLSKLDHRNSPVNGLKDIAQGHHDKLRLKYIKCSLSVHSKASNIGTWGESRRHPVFYEACKLANDYFSGAKDSDDTMHSSQLHSRSKPLSSCHETKTFQKILVNTNVAISMHLDYVLNGKQLKKTEQEKDLGVLTSGTLLWNDQIESCISKANQMLCWISRNLINREKSLMLRVYKTLIRPHLEYCVQLWNPAAEHGNWSLILRIESVQRRFTRMIEEVGLLPYSERLRILQLTTLAERRSRGDLIEVYKANKGFSQLAGVLNFSRSGSNLICKPGKSKSAKITRIRRNFINERVMLSWNKLPSDVKNSEY